MMKSKDFFKFVKKITQNKLALVGLVIVLFFVVIALLAPLLATSDPNKIDTANAFLSPGEAGHFLGTDNYGRDIYSRMLYGARISLVVGIGAVAIGGTIGILLGLVAGYYGGIVDSIIMRVMDALFAFPFILLAITLMTVLGSGLSNVIVAIAVGNVPGFARMIRGQVLSVKEEDYIEVTESLGATHSRILFSHILPNSLAPIISEAALSFLGLGIQPPQASWGNILKEGKDFLIVSPHIAIISGLGILLSVLGLNLFGDGLRDALDPRNTTSK